MSLNTLQNFALNILKETKHVVVQNVDVPEIPSCSECGEKIIIVNYEPFTIL
ncbi:4776_t:CDS:1, partial [Paraglomus occultum]